MPNSIISLSNTINYVLDVLAANPEEINRITSRLKQPSSELLDWAATLDTLGLTNPLAEGSTLEELAQFLTEPVSFEPVTNLTKAARRFKNDFDYWFTGFVDGHILEISAEFPNAVFLLDYCDEEFYYGKKVIHADETVLEIYDGDQQSRGHECVLLNIFAPFVAEWDLGLPFGSLWTGWVKAAKKQLQELEGRGPFASERVPEEYPANWQAEAHQAYRTAYRAKIAAQARYRAKIAAIDKKIADRRKRGKEPTERMLKLKALYEQMLAVWAPSPAEDGLEVHQN